MNIQREFEDAKVLALQLVKTTGSCYQRSSTDGEPTGFIAICARGMKFVANTDRPDIIRDPDFNLSWKDGKKYPARKIITLRTSL